MDFDYLFDYLVVGRGLSGSAAARHLATRGLHVGLIGPEEPAGHRGLTAAGSRASHSGVFGSHYDEGRITRILDPNRSWAQLAQRSIQRYRPLEAATGISFYSEVGHLAVGQPSGPSGQYLAALEAVGSDLAVAYERLDNRALAQQFPYFNFAPDTIGLWQRTQAGYLSPRAHVQAQSAAVVQLGGQLIGQEALAIRASDRGVVVETATASYRAKGAIAAAGGFTQARPLLPRPLQLQVKAHTVLLAEVDPADLATLALMPSLISKPSDSASHFYLLPPIQYPDGSWYLKIGCSETPAIADDFATLTAWFKSSGSEAVADRLKALLRQTLPQLNFLAYWVDTCITTHTPSGYPYIDHLGDSPIVALVGGNGYAGKSADELGAIAAGLLHQGDWHYDLAAEQFQLRYAG